VSGKGGCVPKAVEAESGARCGALFVFAHQDDEIACIGLMRRLVGEGRGVRVAWTTDGAYQVPAEVRRSESLANMSRLGLSEESLEFWDYPDGRSIEYSVEILERMTALMREARPARVYTCAYEGGHPDHDLAHFAAVTAAAGLEPAPVVYELPLYNACGTRLIAFNRFVPAGGPVFRERLGAAGKFFKLRCVLAYRSQLWTTVVPLLFLAGGRLLGGGEPFREVPSWSYLQPPHAGRLWYERLPMRRMLGITFAEFRDAVESALRAA